MLALHAGQADLLAGKADLHCRSAVYAIHHWHHVCVMYSWGQLLDQAAAGGYVCEHGTELGVAVKHKIT